VVPSDNAESEPAMPSLYHALPPDMRGETLYPLNLLRDIHPDLFERERRKYAGRDALLELRIPLLDVLWNDTLHLSPLHPYHLAEAWRSVGLSSPAWERRFFRIPVEQLAGRPSVWFASGALTAQGALPGDAVTRFDPARYRELARPPARYLEYLVDERRSGHAPRPFAHLPHVLVAGPVDVAGVPLVRADVAP
jgi:hypothetical protein